MVKKAIESLFIGKCDVFEYTKVVNPDSKISEMKEIQVLSGIPCRLSYKNVINTNQTEIGNALIQVVKLFYPIDIEIKAGSKVVVTQNNIAKVYKNSGEPAVYASHKELVMEIFKNWS